MEKCRNRLQEVLYGKESNYLYPFLWLHGTDRNTLEDYVEHIYQSGCRAFCVESRPHPDFLGEKWWNDMDILLNKAQSLGMKVWILDDAHFPTGYANGRIRNSPEDLKQWQIFHQEMDIAGPVKNGRVSVYLENNRNGGLLQEGEELVAAILVKRVSGESFDSDGICKDMTEEVDAGWLKLNLPEGKHRLYIITKMLRKQNTFIDYIDMTNADSVKLLLEETYEKHYQHYKEYFGNVIEGFFSDEPGFYNSDNKRGYSFQYQIGADMHLPWNEYIAEELSEKLFEQGILTDNKEKLMRKLLPALWFPCGKDTKKIRAAYMDTLTDLYRRNFTGQISAWCHSHNVLYVGHVIEDNNCHARLGCGPGHYFRALTGQDMSGIDVVLQQILPQKDYLQYGFCSCGTQDGAFNFYGLGKLGASMAHIDTKTHGRAMCEIFGAYGWTEGISMMKWLADHMLVRGLNVFVPHAFTEKEFPDEDCPPHFYCHGRNPQYPYMRMLFEYMNRTAHLLSGGKPLTDIGVLYHAEAEWLGRTMYFHTVGERLMKSQMDYEVIPLEALKNAEYQEGVIIIGSLRLRCLLIPMADCYPEELKICINNCLKFHICVYQVNGKLPNNSREGEIWSIPENYSGEYLEGCVNIELDELADRLRQQGFCQMTISLNTQQEQLEWLRYYHYLTEDEHHIYMLFHEGKQGVIEGNLELPFMEQLIRYDAFNNVLYNLEKSDDGHVNVKLNPGEVWLLISHTSDKEMQEMKKSGQVAFQRYMRESGGEWKRFTGGLSIFGADSFHNTDFSVWKEQKEWENFDIEEEYPGFAGILAYEFKIDSGDKKLALLKFQYAKEAVTVWVNGICAGTAVGEPYTFDISELSRTGTNDIRVEVTTTLTFAVRDSFSKYTVLLQEGIQGAIYYQLIC